MPPEATSADGQLRPSPSLGAIPSPATPGVWMVSHQDVRTHSELSRRTGPSSSFELVVDVTFVWSYPAKSAFVTGTFGNWETTIPMAKTTGIDGSFWVLSKALPPGEYQYKFIIDNVWRHAPDQPITFDERGIINNVLSVTVEACGDVTCFCSGFYSSQVQRPPLPSASVDAVEGVMTPQTMKAFQSKIGVAYTYTEREDAKDAVPVRKAYMHTEISDRPFDVTVVNVQNLPPSRRLVDNQDTDGTISRASSFEDVNCGAAGDGAGAGGPGGHGPSGDGGRLRYDPSVPVVEDAAYAATLNDQDGSLPHTAPYRASALSSDPTELAYSVRARLSSPILGFNPSECHEGIRLTDTNHCAVRVQERGLYKTVRSVLSLRPDSGRRIYYEFFILKQATGGGVCVGLSTKELPLNCLCGTRPNSIGFSTSGNLIRTVDGKETWTEYGVDLDSGCTLGCLASVKKVTKEDAANGKTMVKATIEFFVDGKTRGPSVDYDFVGDLEVFPTLSLFAKNARVYSLFEGQELLFPACLPEDEEITTLDGRPIQRNASNTPQSLGLRPTSADRGDN